MTQISLAETEKQAAHEIGFYRGSAVRMGNRILPTTVWVGRVGNHAQKPQVTLPGPLQLVKKER